MQKLHLLLGLFVLSLITGCEGGKEQSEGNLGPETWLPLKIGGIELEAQIVLTSARQRKGLMYREELPENSGMLFPKREPQRMSFWMVNTPLPLDIGFFDGTGLLLEVHRMNPFDSTRTISHGQDMQYALEMNAGWFARNGLYPGERLNMEMLEKALRQRGANPEEFGLGE